jgi:hypothetical protein
MAVKETKEALTAAVTMFAELKKLSADGVQLADFVAIVEKYNSDPVFAKVMNDGIEGANLIVAELSRLNIFDGFELLRFVPELMKKLK